jgi:hypothetical protein
MHKSLYAARLLPLFALLLSALVVNARAQDRENIAYYLAADSAGIQQVYQLLLDGQSDARQITQATSDVITFGAAYDGLAVAYVSAGQLWLQPIHSEEAQSLAIIQNVPSIWTPVFSPDGQYIAYADGGVWLLDLGTRETRLLLEDADLTGNNDVSEFRRYGPEQFVLGQDGRAETLVVDVRVWESNSVGVYDLATGTFEQLEDQDHSDILPLDSGFVLVYGNNAVVGESVLSFAPSLDQFNEAVDVVGFADLTDEILFAEQAVEIAPDVLRVYGQTDTQAAGGLRIFTFDYNLVSGAGAVNFITAAEPGQGVAAVGQVSPDGAILPIYVNAQYPEHGTVYGDLHLLDLASGEMLDVEFPETAGLLTWQQ